MLAALAALAVWSGCSLERDYEVLTFFFDGVPVPDSRLSEEELERRSSMRFAGGGGDPVSKHLAYVERRCFECHGDQANYGFTTEGFSSLGDGICMTCHGEAVDYDVLHGPVAAGACLTCHEAHVSRFSSLLVNEPTALCLDCHGEEMRAVPRSPMHADLERACLDCHDAHGGIDRSFTRPRESWREVPPAEPAG